MKGKLFKGERIIRILKEAERGMSVAQVRLQHNCAEPLFYGWKSKFGWVTIFENNQLRPLERQNTQQRTY